MSWPWQSTTAAVPCGTCWRCGGQLYENLAHACTTSARVPSPLPNPTPAEDGESHRKETEQSALSS